jgi:GIY-YIG catalytic domain.
VPESGGVYELKSFGNLVYIGMAKNLRRRLLEHYRDKNPNGFRYKKAGFFGSPKKMEDKHLTQYGSTDGELPPWNTDDTR